MRYRFRAELQDVLVSSLGHAGLGRRGCCQTLSKKGALKHNQALQTDPAWIRILYSHRLLLTLD